ncbi:MAG: ribosome small subunit-dependent GTPase A [Anaerolineales bacterium]|nr:ribosome small subunit-dependent GTPase A [Anaerolineales bacterium]
MSDQIENINKLGFDPWYINAIPEAEMNGKEPARITAVYKDRFTVSNGTHEIPAELVGRLLYNAESPLDLPTTGDWVLAGIHDHGTFAVIHQVLPRKTFVKRKTPGKSVDFQLIAANIDTAFIMQSLDDNFSLRRLERYLVMVHEGGITPVVLLSKTDLLPENEIAARVEEIRELMPDLEVLPFSNLVDNGWDRIKVMMKPAHTYCLLGSSGIGKTTLINHLLGQEVFETAAVREFDGKGRHTTTTRQLILLDNGALIVDTPGMRELGNFLVAEGLDDTFTEIVELSLQCQFSDCSHTSEPGCAVRQAVSEGLLSEGRYQNYLRLQRESIHGELSYQERRQRDRERGRYYKSVMKQKKEKF